MLDILLETCAKEFAAKVAKLFEHDRRSGETICEAPILGIRYSPLNDEERPELQQRVVRALLARQLFDWTAPGWAVRLPTRAEEIRALEEDKDPRQRVVGLFARSLERLHWEYRIHPEFRPFVCGLLACDWTPEKIRRNGRLRAGFKPRRLEGMFPPYLCWHTPEEVIANQRFKAWMTSMPVEEVAIKPQPDIRHKPGHC